MFLQTKLHTWEKSLQTRIPLHVNNNGPFGNLFLKKLVLNNNGEKHSHTFIRQNWQRRTWLIYYVSIAMKGCPNAEIYMYPTLICKGYHFDVKKFKFICKVNNCLWVLINIVTRRTVLCSTNFFLFTASRFGSLSK